MSGRAQLYAGEVSVGDVLEDLVSRPSAVTLFRFSAVTWNPHRIHYDQAYAATEGYPGVIVHSHLHGSWLAQMVLAWAGPRSRLREFSWQNRQFAVLGDTLRCTGKVVSVDGALVECELLEQNQDGAVCAPGRAVVELPFRGETQ